MTRHSIKRFSFTLVELLVVVGIIAVLAGLLFTAFSGSMESARSVKCISNLSQIIKAWNTFTLQNPINSQLGQEEWEVPNLQYSDGSTWVDKLLPCVDGVKEVFLCPKQKNQLDDAYGFGMNPMCAATWQYPSKFFMGGFLLTPDETRPRPAGMILKPAQTIVICDSGYVTDATLSGTSTDWKEDGAQPWKPFVAFNMTDTTSSASQAFGAVNYGYDWGNSLANALTGQPVCAQLGWDEHYRALPRHGQTSSTAFADGHVKAIKITGLTDPQFGSAECLFDNQP